MPLVYQLAYLEHFSLTYYTRDTLVAAGPFSLWITSKDTVSPVLSSSKVTPTSSLE